MKIGIIAFTKNGKELETKVIKTLPHEFISFNKEDESLRDFVKRGFNTWEGIIFIGAVGIAVRVIAEHIRAKDSDPAVIVMDEKGNFVIPILAGHIGGANKLAIEMGKALGLVPVITTATDLNQVFAVDSWASENNCDILNTDVIKYVSKTLLEGKHVCLKSDFEIAGELPKGVLFAEEGHIGICISLDENKKPYEKTLNIIPKLITLGVGCKKNTDTSAFEDFILNVMKKNKISLKSVKAISSIDLKKDEPCIKDFSHKYHIPFYVYTAAELKKVEGDFKGSEFVKKITGVDNVCERSAILKSGGKLYINKQVNDGMTLAVGISEWRGNF